MVGAHYIFNIFRYHICPFADNKGAEEGGASVVAEGNNNGEVENKSLGEKSIWNIRTNPTIKRIKFWSLENPADLRRIPPRRNFEEDVVKSWRCTLLQTPDLYNYLIFIFLIRCQYCQNCPQWTNGQWRSSIFSNSSPKSRQHGRGLVVLPKRPPSYFLPILELSAEAGHFLVVAFFNFQNYSSEMLNRLARIPSFRISERSHVK